MVGRRSGKDEDAQTILVGFKSGEERPYKSTEELNEGDQVIIETRNKKLLVVTVNQTEDIPIKKKKNVTNWIIQKLDPAKYKQFLARSEK